MENSFFKAVKSFFKKDKIPQFAQKESEVTMTSPTPLSHKFSFIFSLFFLFFLIFFAIFLIVSPPKEFSDQENRALSQWRAPSLSSLSDGSFFTHFSRTCSDQFPFRARFCELKARAERALGKSENNGVLFGNDGYLIFKNEYENLSVARENLQAMQDFSSHSELSVACLLVPRCIDTMNDQLPSYYAPDDEIYQLLQDTDMVDLIPLEAFRKESQSTQIFYRTDHHWTTHGAYLSYVELAPLLGIQPYGQDFFEQVIVSKTFRGTADSAVGGIAEQEDSIILYRYKEDDRFIRTDLQTGTVRDGFYDFEALAKKDQYRIFLGGNTALLSIESSQSESKTSRPRMLLIKDSFANSLAPFLALHFDLTLLDPRYASPPLSTILAEGDFDRILIVQGVDTLATDRSLGSKLK